jgi:hypothetical protein
MRIFSYFVLSTLVPLTISSISFAADSKKKCAGNYIRILKVEDRILAEINADTNTIKILDNYSRLATVTVSSPDIPTPTQLLHVCAPENAVVGPCNNEIQGLGGFDLNGSPSAQLQVLIVTDSANGEENAPVYYGFIESQFAHLPGDFGGSSQPKLIER